MRLKAEAEAETGAEAELEGDADAETAFPIAQAEEQRLDRRRFLCAAGFAAALAIGGDWAARRAARRGEPELAVALAAADEPEAGAATILTAADGREALVVRVDAGEPVVAFDRRCPHLGCPVLWAAERGRFECPCHHAAFDARTGEVLFGPPRRGLAPARLLET